MKNNLRKLRLLAKIFDLDKFYIISINSEISLQGHFNPLLIKKLQRLKFNITLCDINGYVTARRNNLVITLT